MGQVINFCAGVEPHVLPAKHVEAILVNVPDAAISDSAKNSAMRLFKIAGTQKVMLDSGGYQLHVGEGEVQNVVFRRGKTAAYKRNKHQPGPGSRHVGGGEIETGHCYGA